MRDHIKNYKIIITNDYEVYGDGTGDPENILIKPTERALKLCAEFKVPMTLFVDALELLAFKKAEENKIFGDKYIAASQITKQIQNALRDGHDIQLHLHPQWIDAKPISSDRWQVNKQYWRLPLVPGGIGNRNDHNSLLGLFVNGKELLEDISKNIDPQYECIAFRAGGYCIQPDTDVLKAMSLAGLIVDSTVCPGKHIDKEYAVYDFRSAPKNLPYWRMSNSVLERDPEGKLIEIPVFTEKRTFDKFFRKLYQTKDMLYIYQFLKNLFNPYVLNFDYCKLSSEEMKKFFISATKKYEKNTGIIPIVLTGHSKEFYDEKPLRTFLEWISKFNNVEFTTFRKIVKKLYI